MELQGNFVEIDDKLNYLTKIYTERKPPAEFVEVSQLSKPKSLDQAFTRSKENIPKFLFYYLCLISLVIILVALNHIALAIPILITAILYYASTQNYRFRDFELTPKYAFWANVVLNVLLIIVFTKIARAVIVTIAFSSLAILLIITHASCRQIDSEKDENV